LSESKIISIEAVSGEQSSIPMPEEIETPTPPVEKVKPVKVQGVLFPEVISKEKGKKKPVPAKPVKKVQGKRTPAKKTPAKKPAKAKTSAKKNPKAKGKNTGRLKAGDTIEFDL
jgi:hypothetical protein